jgi:hypothetical protein
MTVKYVRSHPQRSYARVKDNYDDSGYARMTPIYKNLGCIDM